MKYLVLLVSVTLFFSCQNQKKVIESKSTKNDDSSVIYGKDGRRESGDFHWKFWQSYLAKSVAVAVKKDNVIEKDDRFLIDSIKYKDAKRNGICNDERFLNQPSVYQWYCSGFLVGKDKLLTAKHCMRQREWHCNEGDGRVWFFGYQEGKYKIENDRYISLEKKQGYRCKKVLSDDNELDYILIQLDREVEGARPLRLNLSTDEIKMGTNLFTIGHPMGLPQKISDGGYVQGFNKERTRAFANLDTFEGNSGSPVFNALTLKVEGIIVSGQSDFKTNSKKACDEVNRISDKLEVNENNQLKGEEFLLLNQLDLSPIGQ